MKELEEKREADRAQREADMKALAKGREEDMKEIRASINDMGKHVRNMAITSMIGIGAMSIAVIAFIATR